MRAYSEYKASGVEWLGDIPGHWEVSKLKHYISITNGSDPSSDGNIPVYGTGESPFKSCGEFKEGPTVLLGRKGSIDTPHWVDGRYWNVDTAFDTKTKRDYHLRYFWYLVHIMDINPYKSTTAVPSMTQSAYDNMSIPVPFLREQTMIAQYLDAVTGKIDNLISEKRKQVDDLHTYRTSIISEAVTRGLSPDVPLRASDIDWIGDIPRHWESTKAKYYIDIKSGDPISKEDILSDGKYPIYGGGEIIGYTNHTNILKGTIIIGRVGARCGCVRISDCDSWATDNALIVTTNQNPKYLNNLFEAANLNRLNESNAQPLITATKVKDLRIPLPPLPEQQAIADYLDEKVAKIDELIAELEAQLTDLATYRQAVITEAVTGKVDVRDWEPKN